MFNRKLKKEIEHLKTRLNASHSNIDKTKNDLAKIHSIVDKKLEKIKEPNTQLQDNLISTLLEKNKIYVYELSEDEYDFGDFTVYGMRIFQTRHPEEILEIDKVSVDDLQKLGKYESFKADGKTYIITNKKLK